MTGADILVKCLEEEKVEYVFGYPGVAICPFYDSILNTDIKTILVREEQNAAHAASGYARITGKVGDLVDVASKFKVYPNATVTFSYRLY